MDHPRRLGAALLLALASAACAGAHGNKGFDRGNGVVLERPPPPRPLIRLQRTGTCVARCPNYSVEVDVEGGVTYVGGTNVMTIGRATGHLDPDALHQLQGALGKASHAPMPTERCACGCSAAASGVILTTWDKDTPKTFTYDEGCERTPHAVRVLESEVDDLAGTEQWIGTIQQRRLCFEEQRDCSARAGMPNRP